MAFSIPWRTTTYQASWGKNGALPGHSRLRMGLGLLLVANAVLLVLVFRPPSRTLAEQEVELQRVRARHESLWKTVQQMRELRSKLQTAIQSDQQFPQEHFLQRKEAFSTMMTGLEQTASQNRLTPASITYRMEEERNRPGWVSVTVTLGVEGRYEDLIRFINRLEQSPLFWMINRLKVTGARNQVLRLDLELETYIVSL
ncbi:MAG: type 4a pilus biogenesis protein PilO [Acidobacteria bacterium]|nr:type 4a pilus biogenesis protein PilO [Acidobacteriota bacterium]